MSFRVLDNLSIITANEESVIYFDRRVERGIDLEYFFCVRERKHDKLYFLIIINIWIQNLFLSSLVTLLNFCLTSAISFSKADIFILYIISSSSLSYITLSYALYAIYLSISSSILFCFSSFKLSYYDNFISYFTCESKSLACCAVN